MNATTADLNALFPIPPPTPPFPASPSRNPGYSAESTETVLELLKDNHKRWHIFFNDLHFHNHASHHLLAIYAMGATSETLRAAYKTHVEYQKPAFGSPGPIDQSNWKDHLGDEQYYQAYVAFWSKALLSTSMQQVLEEYIISRDANIVPGKDGKKPLMLSRFLGGFLHPLIHCGYGAEFGLPGLIAEGIAQAAVQAAEALPLFPDSLFEGTSQAGSDNRPASPTGGMVSRFAALSSYIMPPRAPEAPVQQPMSTQPHALDILFRVANDPAFSRNAMRLPVPEKEDERAVERVVRLGGEKLVGLTKAWTVRPDVRDLEAKLGEVAWVNAVIYGVGGWAGRRMGEDEKAEFNGDFFLMHLVTSGLLLPSIIGVLTPTSAAKFLETYYTFSLVLYIARGRPSLPIADFYSATSPNIVAPGTHPHPVSKTLPPVKAPNAWFHILQSTLVHPNEHLCKLQRALAHDAALYGSTSAGTFKGLDAGGTALNVKGSEVLDGTLFVRVAGLSANRLGWMREGQEERNWDNGGFFKEL